MKKSKFLILFVLILSIGGLYAEKLYSEGDFRYTVENEKATITDYNGIDKHVIIPERLGEYTVVSIGKGAFFERKSLETVEIPNSVVTIEDEAFRACHGLTTLEIPNSVTSIGDWAFAFCWKLTTLEIPDSVISIGDYAFRDLYKLTTLKIPDSVISIGERTFLWCTGLTEVEIPNSVTSIGEGAFLGCESLKEIRFNENHPVYSFSDGVLFDKKQKMLHTYLISNKETSYVIPNFVTKIGNIAFNRCENLVSIELPDSLTSIGDSAFNACRNLTTLRIPNSLTSIGEHAFSNCRSLTLSITENPYVHKYALENEVDFILE